jgi:protein gp37
MTIEWCHHTFNPWRGKPETYLRTSEKYWKEPLKWNRRCEKLGIRERVFCGSMCDVFDDGVPAQWLADLLELTLECKNLDFLFLTKRPKNFFRRSEEILDTKDGAIISVQLQDMLHSWKQRHSFPDNIWLGVTVENQKAADERIPILAEIPAKVRFLSCEPLLRRPEAKE